MNQLLTINNELHEKWRRILFRTCVMMGIIIFMAECSIFIFNKYNHAFSPAIIRYLLRFLVLPSVLNLIFISGAYFILKTEKTPEKTRNYTVAILFFLICACVQCFHYTFPPILCVPSIAVFMSIIFADLKLTRLVFGLSNLSLILAFLMANFEGRRDVKTIFLDCVVAGIMIFCAYLGAKVLTRYTNEQAHSIHDIYLKQMELAQEAKIEPLTGLLNRRALMESLNQYIYISGSCNQSIIIAVIDLDDFKLVNDTYGHIKGDEVLIALAEILRRSLPKQASAFRYGGEEFVLLFTKQPLNKVVEIVEEMRLEFSQQAFDFLEDTHNITFSGGIAEYLVTDWTISEFFDKADQALYLAKGEGKNQIKIYSN
ncbi:MAG: hypothetical protein CVU96_01445 [Firmicutes bacterium HGW-Firmicutes-20]|jgi:diguanylate cyclase (GGDEF)-like protein|nr:MAG: hypothetical protein CVU96_01445 [Firmicutes bacterium HGW-Firmicutes-20]